MYLIAYYLIYYSPSYNNRGIIVGKTETSIIMITHLLFTVFL